ncbi:radical SAM protein [Alphaproteobacteria bacterium]|nr:radical SAM protein [Alphaproteobacteria bacterium]
MRTKSCKHIQEAIYFGPDEIRTCCQRFFYKGEMKGDASLINVPKKRDISYSEIIAAKKDLLAKIQINEESQCKGCPQLESKEWQQIDAAPLRTISVENHSLCNMKCTYCSPLYFGGVKPRYDAIEAIRTAPVSESDLNIVWGGGEPTARPDFDEIFNQFNDHYSPVNQRIFTNALIYSTAIQTKLDYSETAITTSIDAGTEETFKLVRKNRGLHKVLGNLAKYSEKNPSLVTVKYILTEDNHNIVELDAFVQLITEYNLKSCHFLISTDFKSPELNDDMLYAGLHLYCSLFAKGINALNMDDHFFNRVGQTQSLFELFGTLSNDRGRSYNLLQELNGAFENRLSGPVVLWGTGQQSEVLMKRIARNGQSLLQVKAFVDSNPEKWGTKLLKKEILAPDDIAVSDCGIIIASSNYYSEIYQKIVKTGISPTRIIPNIFI